MVKENRPHDPLQEKTLSVLFRILASEDPVEREVALRALGDIPTEAISRQIGHGDLPTDLQKTLNDYLDTRSDQKRSQNTSQTSEKNEHDENLSLTLRIQNMGAGEKIKLALKGDKEARAILLKSTNRQIYMSVLDNPGIKESEIEMLTKNTSTNSEILRAIGRNREWTANRNVMKNLVMNSKTPVEVSNRFLSRMSAKDLEFVVKSRNLPMAVRNNAKRLIEQKKKGR
jgi:hypothetical protein